MKLKSIEIKNFMGIGPEGVTLDDMKSVNVLIGPNNAGKSSILKALSLLPDPTDEEIPARKAILGKQIKEIYLRQGEEPPFVEIEFILQDTDLRSILAALSKWGNFNVDQKKLFGHWFQQAVAKGFLQTVKFTFEIQTSPAGQKLMLTKIEFPLCHNHQEPLVYTRMSSALWKGPNINGILKQGLVTDTQFPPVLTPNQLKPADILNMHFYSVFANRAGGERSPNHMGEILYEQTKLLSQWCSEVYVLDTFRHCEFTAPPNLNKRLDSLGTNLVVYLNHVMHAQTDTFFIKIRGMIRNVFGDIGLLSLPPPESGPPNSISIAFEQAQTRRINLEAMGGGVTGVIMLASVLLACEGPSVLLWEEPESHLHPRAQERVIKEIAENIGDNTIFLTTHNTIFMNFPNEISSVFLVNNKSGNTTVRRIDKEIHEVHASLGVKGSHMATADIVVYVEGPNDVPTMEAWLDKFDELNGVRIVACPLGGWGNIIAQHFDPKILISLNRNSAVLLDSERKAAEERLDEKKEQKRKQFENAGFKFAKILEGRAIESYFTIQAMKDGLAGIVKEEDIDKYEVSLFNSPCSGEKAIHGFTKAQGHMVAQHMSRPDIMKHDDLAEFFKGLIKMAEKIKGDE